MRKKAIITVEGRTFLAEAYDDQLFFDELPRERQLEYLNDKYPMLDRTNTDKEVADKRTVWHELKREKWPHVVENFLECSLLPYSREKITAAIKILSGEPTPERIQAAVIEFEQIETKLMQDFREVTQKYTG